MDTNNGTGCTTRQNPAKNSMSYACLRGDASFVIAVRGTFFETLSKTSRQNWKANLDAFEARENQHQGF